MSRPKGLKKFLPLHPMTVNALPIRREDEMPAIFLAVRALFDSEVDLGLAMLVFETKSMAVFPLDPARLPTIEDGQSVADFGRVATVAMIYGDTAFFDQVAHCSVVLRDFTGIDLIGWVTAYLRARLASDPAMPAAAAVAREKNQDPKTAIPAGHARDACRRLGLPLAKGARGVSGKNPN